MKGAPPTAIATEAEVPSVELRARVQCAENTVFCAYYDHIVNAQGLETTQYLSVIPKKMVGKSVTGVAVLPIIEGRVGLIRILRHPLRRPGWETPKGMVESDERFTQTGVRELREETGYVATEDQLVDFGYTAPDPGLIVARIKLYACVLTGKPSILPEGEIGHGALRTFSDDELLQLLIEGQIEDACTQGILFRYWLARDALRANAC